MLNPMMIFFQTKVRIFILTNNARLWFSSPSVPAPFLQETVFGSQQLRANPSLVPRFSDPRFYVSRLLGCNHVSEIRQVHSLIAVTGMLGNLVVTNKLLYVYSYHRALRDARDLFDTMSERDPVSWSVIVGGFAKGGEFSACIVTFRELIRSSAAIDNYTLPMVVRACRDALDLQTVEMVQGVGYKGGLGCDRFVCASLVEAYAKCGVIESARKMFDGMPDRDLVTWTVMIGAYAECGDASEALNLFDQMRKEGIIIDKVAMVSVIHACAKLGALHRAKEVDEYIREMNVARNVILNTALIDMFAKCGSIEFAREIFDGMRDKNVISWSTMIAAYGYHGRGEEALGLFPSMLANGMVPNKITFVSLLYACSHSGLVDDGLRIFSSMKSDYSMQPDVSHITCMVDLLGRAGKLDDALKLIEEEPGVEKDQGLWGALLGACRIHKNMDLTGKVARSLLEIKSDNPGHYVLLSNIYANAGRWDEVATIRGIMTQRKLKKIPGWTWAEVNEEVHRFGTGDGSQPRFKEIHGFLNSLLERLETAGYVPDTDFALHDVDEEVKKGNLSMHSEKLALAFSLLVTAEGSTIRMTKNLRICGDCHSFIKFASAVTERMIVARDASRFHHFQNGTCSCNDYW